MGRLAADLFLNQVRPHLMVLLSTREDGEDLKIFLVREFWVVKSKVVRGQLS